MYQYCSVSVFEGGSSPFFFLFDGEGLDGVGMELMDEGLEREC